MAMKWFLQDAKNRFSAVVGRAAAPSFKDLLLQMPRDDEPIERSPVRPRELEF